MSNPILSLAEISAAILSYNSDHTECLPQAIKHDRVSSKNRPEVTLVSAGRMRRHDDGIGRESRPIR